MIPGLTVDADCLMLGLLECVLQEAYQLYKHFPAATCTDIHTAMQTLLDD